MDINLKANAAQLPYILLNPARHVSVLGRGSGKSAEMAFLIDRLNRWMPRAVIAITGSDYLQLFNRTLPSTLKILEQMGYERDVNYVVGKRPPRNYIDSYERLSEYKNVISFACGTRYVLISQAGGSGRGSNIDFEIIDEALTINKQKYDAEIKPTNRGNIEFFGKKGRMYCPLHHGFKYSTSMPYTSSGKWILDYASYYMEEAGINLFEIWNRIVKMQVELLSITNPKEFAQLWNEISRQKQKIAPFISKDGVLFTIGNAFDNLEFLGLSYIRNQQKEMPEMIFYTEILNYYFDKVDGCFYTIEDAKHVYYKFTDQKKLLNDLSDVLLDKAKFTSLYDFDCKSNEPLEIVADWGSSISLFCVCQSGNYDYKHDKISQRECFNFINEFYALPAANGDSIINELVNKFCRYYQSHANKTVVFYKDKYGDSRNPALINSRSFNQICTDTFEKNGWKVLMREHPGMEPPQSDKYLLWNKLLSDEADVLIRINGMKCKHLLISINNSKVKDEDGRMVKDKSSERRSSGVPPQEATHFSDAADKIVWTKYRTSLPGKKANTSFYRISR